jgi:hypothetical protein
MRENDFVKRKSNYGFDDCIFTRTMEKKQVKLMENNLRFYYCIYSYDDGTSYNYNVECKVGLTGFKWIAKMIKDFPGTDLGGGEESFGFMVGDTVRDKDALRCNSLSLRNRSRPKANGSTVYKELNCMLIMVLQRTFSFDYKRNGGETQQIQNDG